MAGKGVVQWAPGEVTVEEVCEQVRQAQWHVVRRVQVVAGLRLLPSDEVAWGVRPDDALYVHGLVVDRRLAGDGLGAALLGWAEGQVARAGRRFLRLDCVETNTALRRYYTRAGFEAVGRIEGTDTWHGAVLLEKSLSSKL